MNDGAYQRSERTSPVAIIACDHCDAPFDPEGQPLAWITVDCSMNCGEHLSVKCSKCGMFVDLTYNE